MPETNPNTGGYILGLAFRSEISHSVKSILAICGGKMEENARWLDV